MTTTRNRRRQSPNSARRRERPKPSRRATIAVILVVVLALLAIPAIGYYEVFVAPLRQTVVRVNDTTFDLGYYVERLRIQAAQSKLVNLPLDLSIEPFRMLDALRDDELIRQYALQFGINVTNEQIDAYIRGQLQPPKQEGEQASKEELDREFQALYRKRLSDVGVSNDEYRKLTKASIMRDIMRERLSDRVPTVTEQVHTRVIVAESEQDIATIKKRLENGEDFGALAKEISKDEETRKQGGDLGWTPRRVKDRPFDEFVFKLDAGGVSEPFLYGLPTPDQKDRIWIVQVTEKADARQLDDKAKEKLKDRALEDWLDEQRQANVVERFFDSDRYDFAIRKIAEFGARDRQNENGQQGQAPAAG